MRFAIHRAGEQHQPDTVYFGLVELDPGNICLAAVDQAGDIRIDPDNYYDGGGVLTITSDGRLALSPGVMESLGISTDKDGRIMLDPFCEQQTIKRNRGLRAVT